MASFKFSFHPLHIDQELLVDSNMVKYYAAQLYDNFHVYSTDSLTEIAEYMAIYAWSPIVFFEGRRKESQFASCNLFALDFDKEKKVVDALAEFDEFQYIVGTTKRHTEAKNKFRVLIPFEKTFTSLFDYKQVMKYLTVKYGADRACADGARVYMPCKRIVAWSKEGKFMDAEIPRIKQPPIENYNYSKEGKTYLPAHVKRFITQGEVFGAGRNQSCFVAGKHLRNAGYSEGDAISTIKKGASHIIGPDFSEQELERAVKSGFSRVSV